MIVGIFLIEKINFPSPEKNLKLILQMKLKSLNNISKLINFIFCSFQKAEQEIDIWSKKKNKTELKNNEIIDTNKNTQITK